jgi:ATP-binding cassette subfamily B multidrug efflux pump
MNSLRRMIHFARPYKWVIIIGFFTVVLPVAMELVVPRLLRDVIDQGIEKNDMQAIWRGSMTMLVAALIGTIATLGQGVCRAQLSQGLAFDLRNALFRHIQSFSFANLDEMQTGQLMTRISSDVDVVRMFSSAGLSLLIRALMMIIGSLILMFLLDVRLSMIMVVLLPIAGLLIWVVMRVAQPMFVIVQRKLSALNTIVQENLAGARVVKAYAREPFEIERFEERNDEYMNQHIKVGRLMAIALPILLVLTNLGMVAVILMGGLDVIGGRLSIGELVAFNSYLMIAMAPVLMLGNILTMMSRAEASAQRVWAVLDTEPSVQDKPVLRNTDDGSMKGQVIFDNVSFVYDGPEKNGNQNGMGGGSVTNGAGPAIGSGHEDVLHGVSFSVDPGQRVALLGATGSGKSTLVNLLPRYYDVTEGAVRIDGADVRDWKNEALRSQIGMVLQETTLFSGTVSENIAYGRPEASVDEIVAAAQAAQAHDFIMALPHGYESLVEARGANFSGGQKQRIAIARALLISPSILVLDDCTSAVDLETEYKIQLALDDLMADRTTFIIAQRISSVLSADQIFVLEKGKIVAHGNHAELLESSPIYQDIYTSQLGAY